MPSVSTRNTGRTRRLLFAATITTGAQLVCIAQSKAEKIETPQPAGFSALSATLPIIGNATRDVAHACANLGRFLRRFPAFSKPAKHLADIC